MSVNVTLSENGGVEGKLNVFIDHIIQLNTPLIHEPRGQFSPKRCLDQFKNQAYHFLKKNIDLVGQNHHWNN